MTVDICIIGSGVAGALSALALGQAGQSVVVLETGRDFWPTGELEYQRTLRVGPSWIWEEAGRDGYVDKSTPRFELNSSRVKAVGGSTLRWQGRAQRLQPPDFKMASLFGLGCDWPLEYEELEPFYGVAENAMGVAGPDDVPHAPPRSLPYPMPAHPLDYAVQTHFAPALRSLGISVASAPQAVTSRPYRGRPACVAYGTCTTMCPSGARYTAKQHIREAESTGTVHVISQAQVTRLKVQGRRRVRCAEYYDRAGRRSEIEARTFIIAAGGVETPRLLLNSADPRSHANGLGNSSGMVGKNFIMGSVSTVWGAIQEPTDPHRFGFSNAETWDFYRHQRPREQGNWIMRFAPRGPKPAQVAQTARAWGRELKEQVRASRPHELGIWVFHESLPNLENRVGVSRRKKDRYGLPVPETRYALSRYSLETGLRAQKVGADILRRVKATDIQCSSGPTPLAVHHMGTTRMGADSTNSVCDTYGRCHDLDNLYVLGSSLFPTAGCSTPTLTLAALALRTAQHLGGATSFLASAVTNGPYEKLHRSEQLALKHGEMSS